MDIQTIGVILIALAIVMPAVWIIVDRIDRQDKAKSNVGAKLFLKKTKRNPVYSIYSFLVGFPLTGGYIRKISRRYEVLSPLSQRRIAEKTMNLVGFVFLLCAGEITLTFFLNPSFNNLILSVYLIFVINNEFINYYIGSAEIKLLDSLERFIANVADNYFNRYHIDDAIRDAADDRMPEELKVHAGILYDILTSDRMKEDAERYNASIHNKYLRMFLSLCVNVIENGDKVINGQRLLNQNLISLQREINLEYLKQKKLRFVFSGSVFAAVIVCVPLSWIRGFGISIAPDLERIYSGQLGILYIGLIFLTSAIVYIMINDAKEIRKVTVLNHTYLKKLENVHIIKEALDNFCNKFYGITISVRDILKRLGETITPKQLLLKSLITSLITFILGIALFIHIHENNKELLTAKVTNIESLTSASTAQMNEVMKEVILQYVNMYKDEEQEVSSEDIRREIRREGSIYNEAVILQISEEVMTRISKYNREFFQWYELLICTSIAVLTFFMPYLMILYRRKLLKANMEDEVVQFNSIIYMMMYSDHVTVMDILEQLEMFSVVFKATLRECMNEYNSGDMAALEKLKSRESYEPFLRLADSLIRCDEISIAEAFNKIAANRENYYERRKQENEKSIQQRADNIQPLSWLPGILVIIYLVAPLLYISLAGLMELRELILDMGII